MKTDIRNTVVYAWDDDAAAVSRRIDELADLIGGFEWDRMTGSQFNADVTAGEISEYFAMIDEQAAAIQAAKDYAEILADNVGGNPFETDGYDEFVDRQLFSR